MVVKAGDIAYTAGGLEQPARSPIDCRPLGRGRDSGKCYMITDHTCGPVSMVVFGVKRLSRHIDKKTLI